MPGFDHLAALAAVPRRSRSTPCALAARPVIVNALSVALPYPLTALPTHLVVLPPHCQPAVPTVSRGSSRSPCPSCSHACSLSSRQSMRFRGWIMAYSHCTHDCQQVRRFRAAGLSPCGRSRSLGSATICLPSSVLEPTGDVAATASGPGRWSPGCLRPPWRRPGSTAFKIVFSRAIL